jgi:hypothetical protein
MSEAIQSPTNRRESILSILLVGLVLTCLEYYSFGNYGFSELLWGFVGIFLIVKLFYLNKKRALHTPSGWVYLGQFSWVIYKYVFWLFASRTGYSWIFIQFLFSPLSKIAEVSLGTLVLCFFALFLLLLSFAIGILVVKNKCWKTILKTPFFWAILCGGIIFLNISLTKEPFLGNCTSFNPFSEGITCRLRNALGWVGSSWVTFFYLSVLLFYIETQKKKYSRLASLPVLFLSPLLLAILINPARILSVILSINHHGVKNAIIQSLVENNILIINLVVSVLFFIVLPLGLILIKTNKMQKAWTFFGSLLGYFLVTGILFCTVLLSEQVVSLNFYELVIIALLSLLSFSPVLYVSFIARNEETSGCP